jgi:hypothetical protein
MTRTVGLAAEQSGSATVAAVRNPSALPRSPAFTPVGTRLPDERAPASGFAATLYT